MDRHGAPGPRDVARIEDDVVFVEGNDDRIEVGQLDDIVDQIGGETYVIWYESAPDDNIDWLDSGDQRLEIDVRETIEAFAYPRGVRPDARRRPSCGGCL